MLKNCEKNILGGSKGAPKPPFYAFLGVLREKNPATGTFVYRHIYIAKMPIFSTKNPDFMKNVIKRLNVSVK